MWASPMANFCRCKTPSPAPFNRQWCHECGLAIVSAHRRSIAEGLEKIYTAYWVNGYSGGMTADEAECLRRAVYELSTADDSSAEQESK